jgi:hypothetical protein
VNDRECGTVLPEKVYQLTSADSWQAAVGYYQIKKFSRAGHELPAQFTITRRHHEVADFPEHPRHQLAQHPLVVYYQNPEGQSSAECLSGTEAEKVRPRNQVIGFRSKGSGVLAAQIRKFLQRPALFPRGPAGIPDRLYC